LTLNYFPYFPCSPFIPDCSNITSILIVLSMMADPSVGCGKEKLLLIKSNTEHTQTPDIYEGQSNINRIFFKHLLVQSKKYKTNLPFFNAVSLKFYKFLPTCGELPDPFFIKSWRTCHGPISHKLLYFAITLKSMSAQCLLQWPKQMIIAGGQIWAVGGCSKVSQWNSFSLS
jgi:hypothetical protein